MKMMSVWSWFKAKDGVTPVFSTMQQSAKRFSTTLTFVGSKIGNAFHRLRRGVFNLQNAFRLFAVSLGIRAIAQSFDEISRAIDKIIKTSLSIGVVAQSLKELQFVGERLGVSSETVTKGLQKLNRNMGELKVGSGTMFTAMQKLAPSLIPTLMNVTDTEQAFYLLIEQIDKMPDTMSQTALAVSAFGRTGVDLLKMTKAGRDEIDALRNRFRMYAGEIGGSAIKHTQAYADSMENLKASVFGLRMIIVTRALPAVNDLIERLALWVSANRNLIGQKVGDYVKALADSMTLLIDNMDRVLNAGRGLFQIGKIFFTIFFIASLLANKTVILGATLIGVGKSALFLAGTILAIKKAIIITAIAISSGFATPFLIVSGIIAGIIVLVALLNKKFGFMGTVIGWIKQGILGIGKFISWAFGGILNAIIGIFDTMFGWILKGINWTLEKIGSAGSKLVDDSSKIKKNLQMGAEALSKAHAEQDFRNATNRAMERRSGSLESKIAEAYRRTQEIKLGLEITPTQEEGKLFNLRSVKGARLATASTGQTAWSFDLGGQ